MQNGIPKNISWLLKEAKNVKSATLTSKQKFFRQFEKDPYAYSAKVAKPKLRTDPKVVPFEKPVPRAQPRKAGGKQVPVSEKFKQPKAPSRRRATPKGETLPIEKLTLPEQAAWRAAKKAEAAAKFSKKSKRFSKKHKKLSAKEAKKAAARKKDVAARFFESKADETAFRVADAQARGASKFGGLSARGEIPRHVLRQPSATVSHISRARQALAALSSRFSGTELVDRITKLIKVNFKTGRKIAVHRHFFCCA